MTVTLGDTYTLSPTKVNSFHATFDRRADNRGSAPNLFGPQALGITNFPDNMPDNYMQITVSNYFNVACGTCAPGYFNVNTYQASDDFTMTKGKHQIGFGFDGRKQQFNSLNNQQSNGQWTFTGSSTVNTGDSLADLELGQTGRSDRRQRALRLHAPDRFRRLRAGYLPRHVAFDNQRSAFAGSLISPRSTSSAAAISSPWPSIIAGVPQQPISRRAPAGLLFGHDSPNHNGCGVRKQPLGGRLPPPRRGVGSQGRAESRRSAPRFGLMHDNTELFYPERWTTNPPYASSIALGTNVRAVLESLARLRIAHGRPAIRSRARRSSRLKALTLRFRRTCPWNT